MTLGLFVLIVFACLYIAFVWLTSLDAALVVACVAFDLLLVCEVWCVDLRCDLFIGLCYFLIL